MNQPYNTAEKTYISVDVEHTGQSKNYAGSIVSIGACVVGDIYKTFYKELKPRNPGYNADALAVASKQLLCVDTETVNKGSDAIMQKLKENGDSPKKALQDYSEWIHSLSLENPTEAAAPIKYDGGLMAEYYRENGLENPLGWNGEDINSLYRGFMCDPNTHIVTLELRGGENPHNALRDAQIQAIEMEVVLKILELNRQSSGKLQQLVFRKDIGELHHHSDTKELIQRAKKSLEKVRQTPIQEDLKLDTH